MGIIKLAAMSALGFAGYKFYQKEKHSGNAAFAPGQVGNGKFSQVRDAGKHAMRDQSSDDWSKTDEEIDESFPASDPPANY